MPLERYREWKRKNNAVGCVFARLMAVDPARYGYRDELVNGNDPASVADVIADRVAAAVADPSVNALALVLEQITGLSTLVEVTLALANKVQWQVSRSLLLGTPIGDTVAFHVARQIPFAGASCPSEVLVLGPFPNAFPNTRCAPVTALEIYVGDPPPTDFMDKPTSKGHLALVNVSLPPKTHQRMAQQTRTMRLDSLGGIDDARAKAKVAFSVPLPLATSLGCVPA